MSQLVVHAGDFRFDARLEDRLAPKTCAAFRRAMPFESQMVHVRWSGEAVWLPLGDFDFGVGYESHTSYPAVGGTRQDRALEGRAKGQVRGGLNGGSGDR